MPLKQMNARIDEDLKAQGDAVFARFGYSPSGVIRAVWSYAVEHQSVPPFLLDQKAVREARRKRGTELIEASYGSAVLLARQAGIDCIIPQGDYKAMRDEYYAELLEEYEGSHA